WRNRERGRFDLSSAANTASCARPRKERQDRSRRTAIVAEIKMITSRIIEIDGALHETQTKKSDVEIKIALWVARDRSDVMKSRNFAVHNELKADAKQFVTDCSNCGGVTRGV